MSDKGFKFSTDRLTAAFEYIGPALPRSEAERIWNGD